MQQSHLSILQLLKNVITIDGWQHHFVLAYGALAPASEVRNLLCILLGYLSVCNDIVQNLRTENKDKIN